MDFSSYTIKSAEVVLKELRTSEAGLSEKEARRRLEIYGPNEIKTREPGLIDIFFRQFKSPFFYLLFVASAIAFYLGSFIDAAVILVFVFINVVLGFFQEAKAQKTVSLLKKYIPSKINVLRGGKEITIDKRSLVPGDIVLVETGNIIPADLRLLKAENFSVDESVLSGESAPVSKKVQPLAEPAKEIFKAENILFAGTLVVSGGAKGVVVKTGREMTIGEIAKLVTETGRQSVYEKKSAEFFSADSSPSRYRYSFYLHC